jgi:hypothetical protein
MEIKIVFGAAFICIKKMNQYVGRRAVYASIVLQIISQLLHEEPDFLSSALVFFLLHSHASFLARNRNKIVHS